MKPLSILAVCVLMFSGCSEESASPATQTPPLIQIPLVNADMESGTAQPDFWFQGPTTSEITMAWTTDQSSSPSHSLEMSRTTVSDGSSFAAWGRSYYGTMPVGKNVTLSIKIKGDNLVGQGVSIALRADGATTPSLQFSSTQGSQLINGTFDWKTYSIELASVTSQAKYIIIYLVYLPQTTGKVYFDDASLTHN